MISLVEGAEDRFKATSALAIVEVRSAIRKRQRMGQTSVNDASAAIQSAGDERRRMVEYPVSALVLSQAAVLIDKHGLRALDAVQLATALIVQETSQLPGKLTFVCADKDLLTAANIEGFQVWNPEEN